MRKKAVIKETDCPIYPYEVQEWKVVDKGVWQYYGVVRFCKTLKEAKREKRSIERERR